MRQGVYSAPKYLNNYPSQTVKKWPEDIQCIIKSSNPDKGSLYLSNVQAAQSSATVKKLRIGAILSCAKGYMISHPTTLVPFYKYIPGEDKETFDISLHFDDAVEFIQQALQKTNIIVHCIAGVSRSASMVIAYFMKHRKISFNQAFGQVKSKRKIISPNDGFIMHLKKYQEKLKFSGSQMSRKSIQNEEDISVYHRTFSGQFYSPTKKYDYQRNYDLSKSTAKNPQSSYKDETIYNRKYQQYQPQSSSKLISPTKNYESIHHFKSQSMTLIPGDLPLSPRFADSYKKSMSKQLSPRKTVNFTAEKPRPLTRDTLYQDNRQKSGYFDSMSTELNAKIQAIRKKYEQQRQQLIKTHTSTRTAASTQKYQQPQRNIYLDLKPTYKMNASFTDKKDIYRTQGKRDLYHMYDKNIDLKLNSRLNNISDAYVPRIPAGYGMGLGYYGKRY